MSILNTAQLNSATLGTSASTPDRVLFAGYMRAVLVCTLRVGSFLAPAKLYRPMLCNAWLFERPRRTVPVAVNALVMSGHRLRCRVRRALSVHDAEPIGLAAALKGSVHKAVKASVHQYMHHAETFKPKVVVPFLLETTGANASYGYLRPHYLTAWHADIYATPKVTSTLYGYDLTLTPAASTRTVSVGTPDRTSKVTR